MSELSVFVGLVTHPASPFNADGSATSRAQALVAGLERRGLAAELLVSDGNDYDAEAYPLDRAELARSARYWSLLEHRWRRYLAKGGGRPAMSAAADWLWTQAMSLRRLAAVLPVESARRSAVRLLNIDLSHLRVLEAAVASGRTWTLVLEDDAGYADPESVAADLASLIGRLAESEVQLANLSESIALADLGVEGIVLPPAGSGEDHPKAWLCTRPVTNTVCANLYRTSFAGTLAAGIRARGLVPVAPIDWRVNEQLLALHAPGPLGSRSCVWVRPGLFLQGSMHATD